MIHAQFLKVTSQDKVDGKMVDVLSFSVCRCGERFTTDHQLGAHVLHPAAPEPTPLPSQSPIAPLPGPPALLVAAVKEPPVD